jgi:hypothetical protein
VNFKGSVEGPRRATILKINRHFLWEAFAARRRLPAHVSSIQGTLNYTAPDGDQTVT